MNSPSSTPLSAGLDYSSLMAPPMCPSHAVYRSVQTDLTINKIKELESKSALDLEMRDNRIEELQRVFILLILYFNNFCIQLNKGINACTFLYIVVSFCSESYFLFSLLVSN